MKISLQEVQDYISCPLLYDFKYRHGLPENENLNREVAEKMLKVVYYFYFKVMDGHAPALETLKNKWETIWFGKMSPMEYMLTPRTDKMDTGQKAVPMIDNFFKENYYTPGTPLVINSDFEVEVGDHEVSGTIHLVREVQDGPRKVIELLEYKTGTHTPSEWMVENDLVLSLNSFAFRRIYKHREQRAVAHYLRSNKYFATMRTEEHYRRMTTTIDMIARCLQRGIFYPRQTFLCSTCSYKYYCSAWGTQN
jgi:CRISPR/Cas system-associated exonuclease Cas4 (RecB family)